MLSKIWVKRLGEDLFRVTVVAPGPNGPSLGLEVDQVAFEEGLLYRAAEAVLGSSGLVEWDKSKRGPGVCMCRFAWTSLAGTGWLVPGLELSGLGLVAYAPCALYLWSEKERVWGEVKGGRTGIEEAGGGSSHGVDASGHGVASGDEAGDRGAVRGS